MYEWMHGCMYEWMHGCMDGLINFFVGFSIISIVSKKSSFFFVVVIVLLFLLVSFCFPFTRASCCFESRLFLNKGFQLINAGDIVRLKEHVHSHCHDQLIVGYAGDEATVLIGPQHPKYVFLAVRGK